VIIGKLIPAATAQALPAITRIEHAANYRVGWTMSACSTRRSYAAELELADGESLIRFGGGHRARSLDLEDIGNGLASDRVRRRAREPPRRAETTGPRMCSRPGRPADGRARTSGSPRPLLCVKSAQKSSQKNCSFCARVVKVFTGDVAPLWGLHTGDAMMRGRRNTREPCR